MFFIETLGNGKEHRKVTVETEFAHMGTTCP